jgi:hypothetical protein
MYSLKTAYLGGRVLGWSNFRRIRFSSWLGNTSGDDVLISGFGKFSVKAENQKRGRNPATGDSMMQRPRRVVTFHCSGSLRKKINQ